MYKLILCTRYLKTRYLAFVCIVSVMLGVATLIVVNSVMSGFSNKLRDRLHGILSEVIIESDRADGFDELPADFERRIRSGPVGRYIAAVSPTIETVAMLQFHVRTRDGRRIPLTKHVRLLGVDPVKHAQVGRFSDYLARQKNSPVPSFNLTPAAQFRREQNLAFRGFDTQQLAPRTPIPTLMTPQQPEPGFPDQLPPPVIPEPIEPRFPGVILGYSIAHNRYTDPETGQPEEIPLLREGDDVFLATVGASGTKPVAASFLVTDFFKAEMSEYDSSFVYVALADLQQLKGFGERVNNYQIALTPEAAGNERLVHRVIIPELRKSIPPEDGRVMSWQQHQGPLLSAIDMERGLLNVLLFLIVGVAGFSVLAIFSMIVSEKIRDIGVIKSLGASSLGVAQIFITYGLLLGIVGCIFGTIAGLLLTNYINEIERGLAALTGQQIFDRNIYYFDSIPTHVEPIMIFLVNIGATGTAVLFSVLPALRAARLHPVRALRFE